MWRGIASAATPEGSGAGTVTGRRSPGATGSFLRTGAPFSVTRPSSIHCTARLRETSRRAASHASSRPTASSPATSSRGALLGGLGGIQLLFDLLLLAPERVCQQQRAQRHRDVGHVEHRPAPL